MNDNEKSRPPAPWLKHYGTSVPASLDYPDITLFEMLENTAARFPINGAVHFLGRSFLYDELFAMVTAFGRGLKRRGVLERDRVMLVLPNSPQFLIACYASFMIGAIPVPVNPLSERGTFEKIVCDSEPKLIVILDRFLHLLSGMENRPQCAVTKISDFSSRFISAVLFIKSFFEKRTDCPGPDCVSFRGILNELPDSGELKNNVANRDTGETAVILYTSGTTGDPKGVELSHKNLIANVMQCRALLAAVEDGKERFLSILPFFHSYGMTVSMHLPVFVGALNVIHPKFTRKDAIRDLEKFRVTVWPAVPAMLQAIMAFKDRLPKALRCVKIIPCGGSRVEPELQKKFEEAGCANVSQGYGTTETSPVVLLTPPGSRKVGTMGIPIPDTDIRIADIDTGEDVPSGAAGELLVHGPQVMRGYWKKPEETQKVLRDGWYRTGDIVKRDDDWFIYHIDRIDDMIKVGGEKVFPSEISSCLTEHPSVKEAAAVGIPDKFWGQIVKAFIVFEQGKTATKDEISAFCGARLAPYKVPRQIEFVEELPKNILGKVLHKKLRQK